MLLKVMCVYDMTYVIVRTECMKVNGELVCGTARDRSC